METAECWCHETYPQLQKGRVSHAPNCPNRAPVLRDRVSLTEQLAGIDGPAIVAVSGGRDYTDDAKLNFVLSEIHRLVGIELLIEGGCPAGDGGADERARKWAKKNEVNCLSVPPKAKKHRWPAAGPIRNAEVGSMKPNVWVLFPGGRGTDSARRVAAEHGIRTIEVGYSDE
jgi:hypothetical protein